MELSSAQRQRVVARSLTPNATLVAVVLGVCLAAGAGAIAATRSFDGLYGQDAYAYFDYSTTSVRQSIQHLAPLEAFFWPPGYPLLVALTSLVVGPVPLAGQLVSLLMGALVPVFTVLLVRELWPDDMPLALVSGAIVAVCGQLWQSSVVVMSDTTGLALATFSAWALVRYVRTATVAWLIAAAAALAFATLARWIYGLVGVPFAIYVLLSIRRFRVDLLAAAAVAALILGPIVGPPLVGLLTHPGTPAAFAGNFQVYSWSPLNAFRRDFLTADGHLAYSQRNGVYYGIAPANLAYMTPLLAIWILPGLWSARRWPVPVSVLIVGWAAIVYAFHAGAPWQNFRFTLAYLPPVAILAAAGLLFAWRALGSRVRGLVALCAVIGLLVAAGAAVRLVERFIDTKDQELALVRWVQAQTPPNAQLFSFGPTLAFRHYSSLPTFDLYDVSPADIHSILSAPAPDFVLVDTNSLQTQWGGQAPSTNFLQLQTTPGLTELGATEGYTLYRVDTPPP